MAAVRPASDEAADSTLRKGSIGVIGIVFFVVAAAAPLVGMTGALPVAVVLGNGAAAPGAYLATGLVLLVFSVGYAAMSHRVTNTGAFFAYVGRGLGIGPGVGSAFVSLLAYLSIQLAIFGFFGAIVAGNWQPRRESTCRGGRGSCSPGSSSWCCPCSASTSEPRFSAY